MDCIKCDLHFNRTHTTPGIGNPNADIVLVSDYPRSGETKRGKAFSHRAYQSLADGLHSVGFDFDNMYFTYLLKCPLSTNYGEYYKQNEVLTRNCSKHNLELNDLPNIKMVIALGGFVTSYLTNKHIANNSMRNLANKSIKQNGMYIHFLYHPIHLKNTEGIENDYKELARIYTKYINHFHISY